MNENLKTVIVSCASVRHKNNNASELETQVLFGERVEILDTKTQWHYCKTQIDNYFGWIHSDNLGECISTNHIVSNTMSCIYQNPCHKSDIYFKVFMNSKLNVIEEKENWLKIIFNRGKIGYIPKNHVKKNGYKINNWVKTALLFEKTPYLWGGRTFCGIDCSGLVQVCLQSANIIVPRNSMDQLKFNSNIFLDTQTIDEGNLIFWKRHVAIAISNNKIIHSNSFHMSVEIETIQNALNRISKTDGKIIAIKKIIS